MGLSPTSKAYRLWLEANHPGHLVLVDPVADWSDPTGSVTEVVPGPTAGLFAAPGTARGSTAWTSMWADAEHRAAGAAGTSLARDTGELGFVHELVQSLIHLERPLDLVVSNSMPIRDLDFVLRPTQAPVRVIANRGANGIDGVLATALGVASASADPTYVLIGDVATVHDLGGLAAIPRLGVHGVTVVVVDNDAGGIFSILPVRNAVPDHVFERLFGTPHGTDLAAVGAAMGYEVTQVDAAGEVSDAWWAPGDGDHQATPRLVVARTTAPDMTAGVADLRRAVADAFA